MATMLPSDPRVAGASPFARRMARVAPSAIMEILKTTATGEYISFASGLPDPDLYPRDVLRAIADEVLTSDGRMGLQYGPAEGYPPLRDWVAERLRDRGLEATPEHILITHGSQQALDLAARLFLDPGDRVVIESPSYLAAIQAFDSYEAVYDAVPLDDEGVNDTEAVARLRRDRPGLLFLLPNYQNPTGITLSLARRERIAVAAAETETPLLEDDAYHDLRYDGEALPPIATLARNPWGTYVSTLSKIIAPGLRVGFLHAQPALVERLAHLKQITDLHTGSLAQRIAYRFCESGHLDPQIERLRSVYRERRDAMLAALDAHLDGVATWTRPAGGMFIFVQLREGIEVAALLDRAMARGIVFIPGASFHPDGRGRNTLRLNFVSESPKRIREGIAVLAAVIRETP
jgi:2-aminoadipate transaminase